MVVGLRSLASGNRCTFEASLILPTLSAHCVYVPEEYGEGQGDASKTAPGPGNL